MRRAQPVEERAAHQDPDGLGQPGDVVDGFGERQPDVVVAVVVLHPQPDAVAVEPERTDTSPSQGRRQPVGQPVDDLAVGRLEVLQPARLHRAERIGSRLQQVPTPTASAPVESATTTDSISSRTSVSRVSPSASSHRYSPAAEPDWGLRRRSGREVRASSVRATCLHAAADPDQRAHRLAQRQRRVVGHLEHRLEHRRRLRRRPCRASRPSAGTVMANDPSSSRWCTGAGGRLDALDREHRAAAACARAADSLGRRRCRRRRRCCHRVAFQ